ncbi:hypothetical protein BDZ89DRAFT_1173344 [Hymenopellis radicata]|nr:hypothetical protein BDZ89DRAFT_1173344 [Hymenopellis radicata]
MGEPLDLDDIALLLNCERASTEPRVIGNADWLTSAAVDKMGFVFDTKPGKNSEERDTPLRVRTWKGVEYITTVGTTYITGDESYGMNHAVLGFASSREGNIDTILDMSSLQFGDAGRGLGGKSLFALESLDEFYDRVETIARGRTQGLRWRLLQRRLTSRPG